MTQKELDQKIFVVETFIEEMLYSEFLYTHGSDETTTPDGIAPRMHIREIKDKFQIWSWGVRGNNPFYTGTSFDCEENADLCIYDYYELDVKGNDNTPSYFFSIEEAKKFLLEY